MGCSGERKFARLEKGLTRFGYYNNHDILQKTPQLHNKHARLNDQTRIYKRAHFNISDYLWRVLKHYHVNIAQHEIARLKN